MINPQRRGGLSGSTRQVAQPAETASCLHDGDAFERYECPEKDAGADPLCLARDIQLGRGSLGEMDVGVSRSRNSERFR